VIIPGGGGINLLSEMPHKPTLCLILKALKPLVTEEHYWALFYMSLYKFLYNLLNVLVQVANKMRLQKTVINNYGYFKFKNSLGVSESNFMLEACHISWKNKISVSKTSFLKS
jgi:hypothetical protein